MHENDIIQELTIEEALGIAVKEPPLGAVSSRKELQNWSGVSFDKAVELARQGDPKTAADIKRRLGVTAAIHLKERAVQRWGVAGSVVDMGRFMSGEPESMIETVRAKRSQPVMKLAVERAVPAGVSIETIRATGASVLAVVEALRTAGVPAEIWVTFTIRSSSGTRILSTQVLVQEAGRPIDVDRLAYWCSNETALRRIAFAVWEQQPYEVRREFSIGGFYGYPEKTIGTFDEVAPAREDEVTAWITDVLSRRAGVTMREADER